MYDDTHLTYDAATVALKDADGVSVDNDGVPSIEWDDVEVVRVDDPPHAEAFDTKRFYKLPATVARPIRQPYYVGEDTVWLKKPRDELKKASWSLDNAPWTLGHPDEGMKKLGDDVHGFWKDPRYIDGSDDLDADLHVPVDDQEGREFIEENSDVSVGFYHKIQRPSEYDGIVGGEDDTEDLDGYQTSMHFDHVASVEVGRCPGSKGCGLDERPHGHVDSFLSTTVTKGTDEGHKGTMSSDASRFVHPENDRWYAVPPDDNPDDEWKFPITSCDGEDSVDSAWHFAVRERGNISISWDTLKERIRSRANDLDCDMELTEESEDADISHDGWYADNGSDCQDTSDCGDCGCAGGDDDDSIMTDIEIDFDDLTPEAVLAKVAAEHDGVEDRLDELEAQADRAEYASAAADTLDTEPENLADEVESLADERDDLETRVEELEEPAKEDHAEFIAERTDRFGDKDDLVELELDDLEEKREIVEDLTDDTSEQTANSGTDETPETPTVGPGGYVDTPWD